jgi:hypothetical protein
MQRLSLGAIEHSWICHPCQPALWRECISHSIQSSGFETCIWKESSKMDQLSSASGMMPKMHHTETLL